MKMNRLTVLLVACLLPVVLTGCAAEKDGEYSTEPDSKYEITYLLTEFEQANHYNAEGVAAEEGRGYLYMFDDPGTELDFVEPRAKDSPMCKKVDEDGELLDESLSPPPPGCAVDAGYDIKCKLENDLQFVIINFERSLESCITCFQFPE